MIQSFTFIGIGIFVYLSADWVRRLYSYLTDKWERDGVIHYGGLSRKVWREDDPQRFASRMDDERFAAAAMRWFLKIFGATFAIGGTAQLFGSVGK